MWSRSRRRRWQTERREFIYLDEVSVISLVAARDGSIQDTRTETLSRAAEAESKYSIAGPIKGVKLGTESRHKVTNSSSQSVVRKSVIQGTFGDLRTGGSSDSLPIVRENRHLPNKLEGCISSPNDLTKSRRKKLAKLGLMTSVATLRRGDVIEVHVRLRPDKMFSFVRALESIVEIVQGRHELFGDMAGKAQDGMPIAEVINELMVGLIPIHGTPTDLALVEVAGELYLMDRRVIRPGSSFATRAHPWNIVAVTEEASYWKDLRRVLYTRQQFTVYARIVNPTFTTKWNPVKLAGLMGDVSKDIENEIIALPEQLGDLLKAREGEPDLDQSAMFERFSKSIESQVAKSPEPDAIGMAVTEAVAIFESAEGDLGIERAAFDPILNLFEEVSGTKFDREDVAQIRSLARAAASIPTTPVVSARSQSPSDHIRQLEVEVVAIYW